MKLENKNIIISGGGTGGHLFPALAIGNSLSNKGYSITYIGSVHGVESNYFKNNNLKYKLLDIYGINRNPNLKNIYKNILLPIKILKSYFKARKIIKKFNPKIIIGTGGYSSGLPLLAGLHLGVPILIQEQNSIPGLVTRKLYKKAKKVCLAYENTKISNVVKNITVTGNPIRENLQSIDIKDAKSKIGLSKKKKTIFILGGSQGSVAINKHIIKNIIFYLNNDYQIIWQCGEKNIKNIPKSIQTHKNIILKTFFNDMSLTYSASDIIISRAGALAISELLYLNKAFILIPYKYAADNHQNKNASNIEENKACIKINENELDTGKLETEIKKILNNKNLLDELEMNAQKLSKPNATQNIIKEIEEIVKND